MTGSKTAYVGSNVGELSLMVTYTDLILNYDLGIPSFPSFILQVPLQDLVDKDRIFNETFRALTDQMLSYLASVGVPVGLVEQLEASIMMAIKEIDLRPQSVKRGDEELTLLEKIVELEPVDLLEVRFPVPPGFTEAVHEHIVTAAQVKRDPPTIKLPKNFQTGGPAKVVQNGPSLKNLITKFRGQQNKPLTGPIFIMVYDVNGRPVGVRQLRGPGWKGIGGKMAASGSPESRTALWLLPDNEIVPVQGQQGNTHAQAALQHFPELAEDMAPQDVLHYAMSHGWIRIWLHHSGILVIQAGTLSTRDFRRLQQFVYSEDLLRGARDVQIEIGAKNRIVDMKHFLVSDCVNDLDHEPEYAEDYDDSRTAAVKTSFESVPGEDGKPKLFTRPDKQEVHGWAMQLYLFMKQNGVRLTKRGLTQQSTGTFYIGFYGPITRLERKIRISDHPAPFYNSKELALERHQDFSVDPEMAPGHTVADAMEFIKTAAGPTDSPAFRAWFGQSKVVDKRGQPLKVYHGTTAKPFNAFSGKGVPDRGGLIAFFSVKPEFASGYAQDKGHVYPVYLKIEDPFDYRTEADLAEDFYNETGGISDTYEARRILMGLGAMPKGEDMYSSTMDREDLTAEMFRNAVAKGSWDAIEAPEFVEWLRGMGKDGVVMREGRSITYGIFDPRQAKSAIGNSGEFNPKKQQLTARSFSGGDIPENFWIAFDIDPKAEHFAETMAQLKAGVLQGVRGISATGEILLEFLCIARNSFLRMPGNATVELNKISRVMYDNPEYLLSNDMAPLYRIYNQNPERDWSRGECMGRIMSEICHAMRDVNGNVFYSMDYCAAWQRVGRLFAASGKKIKGLQDFITWTHAAMEKALSNERMRSDGVPMTDWVDAVRAGFNNFHKVYGSENEWLLKDSTLRIPPDSTLVIGLDLYAIEAYDKWQAATPAEREVHKMFGNHRTAEQVQALKDTVAELQADTSFTTRLINITPFGLRRPELMTQRYERRRKNNETGYRGASTAKLFTRPGVPQ